MARLPVRVRLYGNFRLQIFRLYLLIFANSLEQVVQRPGISSLSAVSNTRVFGLWHNFYNAPINLLAVEAMAKWFHPELFEDINPEKALQEINEQFFCRSV